MNSEGQTTFEVLSLARQMADYAEAIGATRGQIATRTSSDHLGAVLADSVLQAGLNYRTVVRARVERIICEFPDAATLTGTLELLHAGYVNDFLMWSHSEKIERFVRLVLALEQHKIEHTTHLKVWLDQSDGRANLLRLHGIGPKTVDYLGCLIGLDWIAVDRHLVTFAYEAGISVRTYEMLKQIASFAADLLEIRRRDFDFLVWRFISSRNESERQQLSML